MLSDTIIEERLTAAGIDVALRGLIAQKAYYAEKMGEDPEDFLQEAILACLGGENVTTALGRIWAPKRHEVSLDSLAGEDEDSSDVMERLQKTSSDNERPDWIPNNRVARMQLISDCFTRLVKKRTAVFDGKAGGWRVSVMFNGEIMQFTGYETKDGAERALRAALGRIIGWCMPLDDGWFTTVCVRCGGPKSKYGVRFCRPCAKGGAIHEMNVLGRHA